MRPSRSICAKDSRRSLARAGYYPAPGGADGREDALVMRRRLGSDSHG